MHLERKIFDTITKEYTSKRGAIKLQGDMEDYTQECWLHFYEQPETLSLSKRITIAVNEAKRTLRYPRNDRGEHIVEIPSGERVLDKGIKVG